MEFHLKPRNIPSATRFVPTALALAMFVSAPAFAAPAAPQLSTLEKLLVESKPGRFEAQVNSTFLKDEVLPKSGKTLRQEIQAIFANNGCPLPEKIKSKLNKDYPDGYIPEDLDNLLFPEKENLPTFRAIKDTSASVVLNTVSFAHSAGAAPTAARLRGSASYVGTNPLALIDQGINSTVYTMDCSGYFSAALSLGVSGFGGLGDFKGSANQALKTSRAMLVAKATVSSPIVAAFFPNNASLGSKLSNRARLDILYSIANEVDMAYATAPLTLPIIAAREYKLLWASNSGSSSMQGQATTSANVTAGLGVVNFQGSTSAAGTLARQLTFSSYNTYVLDESNTQDSPVRSYGQVLQDSIDLVKGAATSDPASLSPGWVRDHFEASFADFNENICNLPWAASVVNGAIPGAVSAKWIGNICTMSFKPAVGTKPTSPIEVKAFGLTNVPSNLPLSIVMPIQGQP